MKKLLIIEDEEVLLSLLQKKLIAEGYDVSIAENGEKGLEVMRKAMPDLILLDIVMPDMNGYEVCERLKTNEETKNIPILFITSSTDEESIMKAYHLGAIDYVTKPFKSVELIARVKINLKLQSTIRELEYMAYFDVLTQVYNRRKFFELASQKFDKTKVNLYAIMLDIDHFKKINDTHGHSVGDEVIKAVAQTIQTTLDEDMIFGRIGGEEFAILLESNSDEEVRELIETIRLNVQAICVETKRAIIECTISSGTSKYSSDIETIDQLLNFADQALYQAKESGRNKTIFRV